MLMRTYQRGQICKVDETIDETQMDHVENVLRIMEMCDNDIIIDAYSWLRYLFQLREVDLC